MSRKAFIKETYQERKQEVFEVGNVVEARTYVGWELAEVIDTDPNGTYKVVFTKGTFGKRWRPSNVRAASNAYLQCKCGACRIDFPGSSGVYGVVDCACHDCLGQTAYCQKAQGVSAYNISRTSQNCFMPNNLVVTRGEDKIVRTVTTDANKVLLESGNDGGAVQDRFMCGDCNSPLFSIPWKAGGNMILANGGCLTVKGGIPKAGVALLTHNLSELDLAAVTAAAPGIMHSNWGVDGELDKAFMGYFGGAMGGEKFQAVLKARAGDGTENLRKKEIVSLNLYKTVDGKDVFE